MSVFIHNYKSMVIIVTVIIV